MKLLVAVKSCQRDYLLGAHQLIRDTWGQDAPAIGADLKFFLGGTCTPATDEVLVDAPDDYVGLPYKTREIMRYAVGNKYDFAFLCDTDSLVISHHLMKSGFEKFDYFGHQASRGEIFTYTAEDPARGCPRVSIPECYPFASGGGYVVSRKAMEFVANAEPFIWAEDAWVAQVLGANGIRLHDANRYRGYVVGWFNDYGRWNHRVQWMKRQYELSKEKCRTSCNWPELSMLDRWHLRRNRKKFSQTIVA
jgi:hypothetical protein